ncbi:ClpXP adapter SpxH family protein [Shouchella shacheensis]|uniref:ClpXP adapter SpxH family protein n=1 Tax=Shouchella shacheensis TaxID=1649580 RepID=UPI00074020EA|nr:ClpXP adapter SpxH family protein [Shouchella shacheensis]
MNLKQTLYACHQELGICGLHPDQVNSLPSKKPLEVYTFIDPLCAQCWAIEPVLKKLQVEYGHYFKIRVLLAGKLQMWNDVCESLTKQAKKQQSHQNKHSLDPSMCCSGSVQFADQELEPYKASLAIKAAELQGPKAGHRFLRKLREGLFLKKLNITDENVLLGCAREAKLDEDAFLFDLYSTSAAKALQCDVRTTNEMDVDAVPTFVFFNDNSEDAGIKVSGTYSFSVYIRLLEDMLGYKPEKAKTISLEDFLQRYGFVATVEVATVFDMCEEEAEKQLKALMLQQKVEAVPFKYGTFWRYVKTSETK